MTVWEQRALSVLRIVVGLLFMEHGTAKLFGFPTAANHPGCSNSCGLPGSSKPWADC